MQNRAECKSLTCFSDPAVPDPVDDRGAGDIENGGDFADGVTFHDHDELGRLKTVTVTRRHGADLFTPEVTTCSYTEVGSRESITLPSGIATTYQYNDLNRLTDMPFPLFFRRTMV